jgi:hypothetical protein
MRDPRQEISDLEYVMGAPVGIFHQTFPSVKKQNSKPHQIHVPSKIAG